MAPKRKAANSWALECRSAIEAGDASAVGQIEKQLKTLQWQAQARCIALQQVTGTGVRMVDSNQSQDQDVGYNMCSRSVDSTFTVGPKAVKFSIRFSNENVEGDETILVESDLFRYEDDEFGEVTDADIGDFLLRAGLQDALPERASGECSDPAVRRRWVYGDVVCDAVECVVAKYGHEDGCGVGLGMNCESIYGWLGLEY